MFTFFVDVKCEMNVCLLFEWIKIIMEINELESILLHNIIIVRRDGVVVLSLSRLSL